MGPEESSRMARQDAAPAKELARLRAEQERLRQRQIVVLREELTKAMERVEALRRELRLLGDHEVASFWGKTNWHQIFERLPPTFTAKDMAALTGAPPSLVGTITHRWRRQQRIVAVVRGKFKKVKSPSAEAHVHPNTNLGILLSATRAASWKSRPKGNPA